MDKRNFAFCQNTKFLGLEILEFIGGDKEAFVVFFASLKQEGRDISFNEKSHFKKVSDQWLYFHGVVENMY